MAMAVVLAGAAAAQTGTPPSSDPRDFQGTWDTGGLPHLTRDLTVTRRDAPDDIVNSTVLWPTDDKMPPFTAWGKARFDSALAKNLSGKPFVDLSTRCMPHGVPRIMVAPYGVQIVQTKGLVTLLFAINHNVRLIHMDRPMPAKVPITLMGYSVGHWEGDTLVVHTKGVSDASIMDVLGTPHSDEMQVTERLRKVDGGRVLENMITIDDPIAYTRPWTARAAFRWDYGHRLMEYVCEENNRNAPDADGNARTH